MFCSENLEYLSSHLLIPFYPSGLDSYVTSSRRPPCPLPCPLHLSWQSYQSVMMYLQSDLTHLASVLASKPHESESVSHPVVSNSL